MHGLLCCWRCRFFTWSNLRSTGWFEIKDVLQSISLCVKTLPFSYQNTSFRCSTWKTAWSRTNGSTKLLKKTTYSDLVYLYSKQGMTRRKFRFWNKLGVTWWFDWTDIAGKFTPHVACQKLRSIHFFALKFHSQKIKSNNPRSWIPWNGERFVKNKIF